MLGLVAAAVVTLAAVVCSAAVVDQEAVPRDHHMPFPTPMGQNGQDLCSPITATFATMIEKKDMSGSIPLTGRVTMTETVSTSFGQTVMKAYLKNARFDNIGAVTRKGAGVLDKNRNMLTCTIKFESLDAVFDYSAYLPRVSTIREEQAWGTASATTTVHLTFRTNLDGLRVTDEVVKVTTDIKSINLSITGLDHKTNKKRFELLLRNAMTTTIEEGMEELIMDTHKQIVKDMEREN